LTGISAGPQPTAQTRRINKMNSVLRKIFTIAGIAAAVALASGCATEPEKAPEAPAPKPVAATPKPVEKPVEKKAKPEFLNVEQKIELQGMPFAKAEMTPDNKSELDKFMAALRKATKAREAVNISAVVVTGHTDRIGSLKYNMGLSERRAVVVKDYLVSQGVDQKVIFWEGKAFKQPIPVTKFCDNKMKRKQLIECLAPNRRVTVEVVGRAISLAKPKPAAKPAAKKPASKPAR
jgi:OmpA-OmpF porin, OOP family